ncbi:MAG: ABC transporter ATP-binding protein [Pseudomonadota bacterium]|nr:ABC transporter ATP-binding protein [Pseudomonadota bacterium]
MIRIKNLNMTYRSANTEHHAVRGVSLEIETGQFYTLLGPSGCGKTTTLRCVAGLEEPDSGTIEVGDDLVYSSGDGLWTEPFNRDIGMVFQSYAIWPHMSVFENVAFPLRQMKSRPSRSEIRERVMRSLSQVQLNALADRPAPFLSGGQQQRLALARALVSEPKVLLLDEPLSNLDAKLRDEMRSELRDLVKAFNLTTLFVTHEQIEALTMSDRIGVMHDGVIVQEGTPAEIYGKPTHTFVADFIGKSNIFKGGVSVGERNADGLITVETTIGQLKSRITDDFKSGDEVLVVIRPESITVGANGVGDDNVVEGTVGHLNFLGNIIDCSVDIGGQSVQVQLSPPANVQAGQRVTLSLPPDNCIAMRDYEQTATN